MSNNETEKKRPSHEIFQVSDGERSQWTKIGAAWLDKTGEGFTLKLDAIPLTGRVSMRPVKKKAPASAPV